MTVCCLVQRARVRGEVPMRRIFGGRSHGIAIVGMVFVAVALVSGCGDSHRVAAPVRQTIAGPTRNLPGPSKTRAAATHGAPVTPAHLTPHQLFLTRAHSAVFNVKSLKSVVVKKERPEPKDPLGGD